MKSKSILGLVLPLTILPLITITSCVKEENKEEVPKVTNIDISGKSKPTNIWTIDIEGLDPFTPYVITSDEINLVRKLFIISTIEDEQTTNDYLMKNIGFILVAATKGRFSIRLTTASGTINSTIGGSGKYLESDYFIPKIKPIDWTPIEPIGPTLESERKKFAQHSVIANEKKTTWEQLNAMTDRWNGLNKDEFFNSGTLSQMSDYKEQTIADGFKIVLNESWPTLPVEETHFKEWRVIVKFTITNESTKEFTTGSVIINGYGEHPGALPTNIVIERKKEEKYGK